MWYKTQQPPNPRFGGCCVLYRRPRPRLPSNLHRPPSTFMKHKSSFSVILIAFFHFSAAAQSGDLDMTFGLNGFASYLPQPTLNKTYSIVQQTDLKILMAGYALSGSSNVFVLSRLLPDGMPDPDFGTNGVVQTTLGTDALCYAMALQADGKILLTGGAATSSNGSKDFALVRYLPNGIVDSSFASDGIQTISFGSGDDIARAIIIQPDGNILVSGTSTNGNNALMAIARFKPDGMPDGSFSGDGKNTLAIGTIFTNGYAMALLQDNKILLTGAAKFGMQDDVALARFLPNGAADLTFGVSGHITTNLGSDADSGNAIAIQSDGKIMVAGITGVTRDFALMRYLTDGTLDPDFGNQGVVTTDFAGSDDYANGIILQSDGKILVGGYAYNGGLPDFALARYLYNGDLDPDFGLNGKVLTDINGGYDYGFPLTLQTDGKLLQAGYSYSSGHTAMVAARYLTGLKLGTLNFSAPNQIFVAPNPVSQKAIIEFETLNVGSFSLQLLDVSGQSVQTFFKDKNLSIGKQVEPLLFNSNLPDGWYVLQLSNGINQYTVKIIKR